MTKITYVGYADGVDVQLPDGSVVTVLNGETADLPDDIAQSLIAQGWEAAAGTPAPKKTKSDPPADAGSPTPTQGQDAAHAPAPADPAAPPAA